MNMLWGLYGGSSAQAEDTHGEVVSTLCSRIATSTLLEDRRAALHELKGIVPMAQLEVPHRPTPISIVHLHLC